MKTAGRLAVRQTDDDTCEMRISSAQRSDTGLYVCKIVNEYGSEQAECRVEVKGEAPSSGLLWYRRVGTNIRHISVVVLFFQRRPQRPRL